MSFVESIGRPWDEFIEYLTASSQAWEHQGMPPPDLFCRLGATGALASRWDMGRRAGLRKALAMIEDLASVNGGVTLAVSVHSEVFVAALDRFRSSPAAEELIEPSLSGTVVGALAVTEDSGGSDPATVSCRAEARPGGGWRITGHKRYISNLDLATHVLLLANAAAGPRRGPTLFLLDLRATGVERAGTYPKLGTRSVNAWRLELDVEVPSSARLGPIGGGLAALLPCLRYERLAVSCAVLAGARHALDLSIAYLRTRTTAHGKLIDLSALSHAAAAAFIRLKAATALLEQVVVLDLDRRATDADYASLKYHSATTACEVTDVALQLMGGRGYTANFPHERIARDVRLARIGAGTDEMMLEIVGRSLSRSTAADTLMSNLLLADQPMPKPTGAA